MEKEGIRLCSFLCTILRKEWFLRDLLKVKFRSSTGINCVIPEASSSKSALYDSFGLLECSVALCDDQFNDLLSEKTLNIDMFIWNYRKSTHMCCGQTKQTQNGEESVLHTVQHNLSSNIQHLAYHSRTSGCLNLKTAGPEQLQNIPDDPHYLRTAWRLKRKIKDVGCKKKRTAPLRSLKSEVLLFHWNLLHHSEASSSKSALSDSFGASGVPSSFV
ncbi:hypothetical protein CEXT_252021 [Caerostris extrusa]|uniref:Uncharacterized protein n=1 Tax=Caerostris extrusa TaxID=172846 RepID=A0AAV4TQD6_CAEEX|nr:hypothetical protein CEXT_252021 [Caerostris extrusa]